MTGLKRGIAILCMAALCLQPAAAPVTARAVTVNQANKLNKSDKMTLAESWYFGIYQKAWLEKSGNSLTKKQTNVLGDNLAKIVSGDFSLKKDKTFKKESFRSDMRRKDVIALLYNKIGQYKLPAKLNKAKTGSVNYFVKRGILTKTKKKQYLAKKCTPRQAIVWATLLYYDVVDAKNAGSKGFFWKASKGSTTVYLMGSIHDGITEMYPVTAKVRSAFRKSDCLYVECITDTDEAADMYLSKASYSDGTTIRDHISAESYEELTKVCQKYNINQKVIDSYKPWYVANLISSFYQYNTENYTDIDYYSVMGVDNFFIDVAEQSGMMIDELESVESQLDIFDSMSEEDQRESLDYYLDKVLYSSQNEKLLLMQMKIDMWRCWAQGDYKWFRKNYLETDEPEDGSLQDSLTGERDTAMADKLAKLLEKDDGSTYFVVIGAAHVESDGLVVDQMKEKGYQVTRVQ